jgi:hypothetical protein
MKKAIIYKPCKNVMQSGVGNTKNWIFAVVSDIDNDKNNLMSWFSSYDTAKQTKLFFKTSKEAIDYAKKNGYSYEITDSVEVKREKKSYSTNFTKDLNLYY